MQNNEFPEVCGRQLLATKWYARHFTYLADKEPIHIKEMRGYLKALYTKLIDPSNWNQRHLFLNDNLGMALAVSKGRCRDAHLLMLMRRAGALVLLTGCAIVNRLVPSELNGSDGPSRVHEPQERQKGPAENLGKTGKRKFAAGSTSLSKGVLMRRCSWRRVSQAVPPKRSERRGTWSGRDPRPLRKQASAFSGTAPRPLLRPAHLIHPC